MKMKNKGITLSSLVITIILILILSTTIIASTYTGSDYKKYKSMCADIHILEDKVLVYYNKYGDIPTTGEAITTNLPTGVDNNHSFYKIDVNKISNLTLNYGDADDTFIIDTTTFEVYYLNGITYNNTVYYTD